MRVLGQKSGKTSGTYRMFYLIFKSGNRARRPSSSLTTHNLQLTPHFAPAAHSQLTAHSTLRPHSSLHNSQLQRYTSEKEDIRCVPCLCGKTVQRSKVHQSSAVSWTGLCLGSREGSGNIVPFVWSTHGYVVCAIRSLCFGANSPITRGVGESKEISFKER